MPWSGPEYVPSWGPAVDVIGEADEVEAAIEMINERVPDVVLLDVHLPGGGGQAVIAGVVRHHPEVRFLALSVSDAPEDVIAVIRAGARGYVTKTISGEELLEAVRTVAAGDAVFSPRLAGFVLDAFAAERRARRCRSPASTRSSTSCRQREREVLRLIARGYTYKEVARELVDLGQDGGDHTSPRSCASCSSRPGTSSPDGPPTGGSSDSGRAGHRSHAPDGRSSSTSVIDHWAAIGRRRSRPGCGDRRHRRRATPGHPRVSASR